MTDYLMKTKSDAFICRLLCCTEGGKSHLLLSDGKAKELEDEMTSPNDTASWQPNREFTPGHSHPHASCDCLRFAHIKGANFSKQQHYTQDYPS